MTALRTITAREASIFAAVCDTVVAPAGTMPAVWETDAAFALDANLAAAPPLNRAGMRALLFVLEVAPLALGKGRRLRRLDRTDRAEVLRRLAGTAALAGVLDAMTALAQLSYYGDLAVLRSHGYDPEAVVARAAQLRAEEARW